MTAKDDPRDDRESADGDTRERRALSHLGGPIRSTGPNALAGPLRAAWSAAASAEPDALTHGFHSWPARMPWALARSLLSSFPGRSVLDPFCGGGTVLVEARVAGRRSIGIDLNPLSVRLAALRAQRRTKDARARLLAAAELVAAASEERVRRRVPIQVSLPSREVVWYHPHVLKELGGLLAEIRELDDLADQSALELVFSAIVHKVSKQRSDTAERAVERRIRKGLPTELFLRKAEELVERQAELAPIATGPAPELHEDDARDVAKLADGRKVDLILTSPPYGGTYDYSRHHARRLAWLKLSANRLEKGEIGARRKGVGPDAALRWDREVSQVLRAQAEVLAPGGTILWVIGDGQIGGRRVSAPAQVGRLAPHAGLELRAVATQDRPDPRGGKPRGEHILLIRRAG